MGIQLGGRRRGFREINVTPLVDVMLVLLVVFMVTAPLLTTGLRIDLPEVKAAQTPVKDARLLQASLDGILDILVPFNESDRMLQVARLLQGFLLHARYSLRRVVEPLAQCDPPIARAIVGNRGLQALFDQRKGQIAIAQS